MDDKGSLDEGPNTTKSPNERGQSHGGATENHGENHGENYDNIAAVKCSSERARNATQTSPYLERRLIRLTFWDTLWEQFGLSDQSARIDASLWRKTPLKPVHLLKHTTKNSAERYENEMVQTYRDLNCSGASPTYVFPWLHFDLVEVLLDLL